MRFVYTGPSWAASSYPTGSESTNLAKEWNIPHVDYSMAAASVLNRVNYLKHQNINLPIIWVYNEPLNDLTNITGLLMTDFLTDPNWEKHRDACNQYCLDQISKLGRPVLLIGGHSDIKDCDFSNIQIAHPSWQKFIAEKAGLNIVNETVTGTYDSGTEFKVKNGWGAEVVHRCMFENPQIDPTIELVNSVWDTFFFWKEIERLGWFYEVHPNIQATESFAEFLLPTVNKFLEDTK